MGQVWQATDTQLNREVALKILPDAFADDPDRLARFKREAQILASLNHPNIAAIYGIEEAEGTRALVLELVEGPTLADRISKGPIPLDEALPIARQIAEALEAAHEAGVIHRDLKPANIKVRKDGTVKVLDFGLAKALDPNPDADPSQSPTLTAAATQMGVIIGTAAYMSPEQASGQIADKRSDIWSFGVVLYEMLTGQCLFTGETISHVLAKVLDRELDFNALPTATAPPVRRLLRRCLERKPKRRLSDMGEALIHLEEATTAQAEDSSGGAAVAPVSQPARRSQALPWVAGIVIGGLITGGAVWSLTHPATPLVSRFSIPVEGLATAGLSTPLALSPDGRTLVYAAFPPGDTTRQLYRRLLDQVEASPIRGTEGGAGPFFSPDGEWLGFWAIGERVLKKVSLAGGPPTTLTPVNDFRWASWGPDGTIVFAGGGEHLGLWLVADSGGAARQIATVEEGVLRYIDPQFLPDGNGVLFTIVAASTPTQVAVLSLETGEHTILLEGNSARVTSTGHLVFTREDSLWAVPFDAGRLELRGDPSPVLEGVQPNSDGVARMALAEDGSLVYVTGAAGAGALRSFVWVDREGREEPLPLPPRAYFHLRLSPDGTRVAVGVADDGAPALWVYDVGSAAGLRLTQEARAVAPLWTPDGERVVFTWNVGGSNDLFWIPADGSGEGEPLTTSDVNDVSTSVTPDGRAALFVRVEGAQREIWEVALDGEPTPTPVLQGEFARGNADVSPDGRWMAYRSDQSGQMEIYLQPYPGPGPTVPVSIGGGDMVTWSSDGSELFYRIENRMMAVGVNDDGTVGTPRELFDGNFFAQPGGIRNYHVAPDGRFLMLKSGDASTDSQPIAQVLLVQNWFEELKERVPVN